MVLSFAIPALVQDVESIRVGALSKRSSDMQEVCRTPMALSTKNMWGIWGREGVDP